MIGYVFGLVLFAEIISRARLKKSARDIGSHNPGTANITRQMGIKWGLVVLAGDLLKTAAACWLTTIFQANISPDSMRGVLSLCDLRRADSILQTL